MELHVGCAMWSYAPWQGRFLPPSLGPRERQHLWVRERLPLRVSGHAFNIVATCGEFAGYRRRQHLVQQEPHRRTAACPAVQAACASAASCSLLSIH